MSKRVDDDNKINGTAIIDLCTENGIEVRTKAYPNVGMFRMNAGNMLRARAKRRHGLMVNGEWRKAPEGFPVGDLTENRDGSKIAKSSTKVKAAHGEGALIKKWRIKMNRYTARVEAAARSAEAAATAARDAAEYAAEYAAADAKYSAYSVNVNEYTGRAMYVVETARRHSKAADEAEYTALVAVKAAYLAETAMQPGA